LFEKNILQIVSLLCFVYFKINNTLIMKVVNAFGVPIWSEGDELFWESVRNGQWEPETFRAIDHFIVPGRVFIDIGAWNGVFSIYAAKKSAWVIATEPDPVAYDKLQR